jgi:hypothetical protein
METTQDIINFYADLLVIQYVGKPKAYATMQLIASPIIMDLLPILVQMGYDVSTAVGVQLDVLGKYAGVTRNGYDFNGPVSLDDDDFRLLVQLSIIQNNGGSSLADIQLLLSVFFPGTLLVFDNKDMSINYFFDSTKGSITLAQFFIKQHLLPRPMGVLIDIIIYAPSIANFFGFRTYTAPGFNISPYNNYTDYQTDFPWLSYKNRIQ